MEKTSKTELKLQDIKTIETIKTLGNYSEKEKVKYEFEKTRNFYNSILDMVHKFRIKNVKSSKNTIIPKQEASNNDKQVAWMLPCCI